MESTIDLYQRVSDRAINPKAVLKKVILMDYDLSECIYCHAKLRPNIGVIQSSDTEYLKISGKICMRCSSFYECGGMQLSRVLETENCTNVELEAKYLIEDYTQRMMIAKATKTASVAFHIIRKKDNLNRLITLVAVRRYAKPSNDIYFYTDKVARRLLTARMKNEFTVSIDGNEYDRIDEIKLYEQRDLPHIQTRIDNISLKPGGGLMHYEDDKKNQNVSILLYSPKTECLEEIYGSYDREMGEYYIDLEVFRSFLERYGNPGIPIKRLKGFIEPGKLRDKSILAEFGYNVKRNSALSKQERQELLGSIMDCRIAEPHEVLHFLSTFIGMHTRDQDRFARDCWKDDMKFVENYKVNPTRYAVATIGLK